MAVATIWQVPSGKAAMSASLTVNPVEPSGPATRCQGPSAAAPRTEVSHKPLSGAMPSITTEPSAMPATALCTPANEAAPTAPGSGRMPLHDPSGRRSVWNSTRRSTSYGGSRAE
ncbi:hypothetical protein GCM10010215_27080 [Streptomyces virginiae]|uniref:Uncharacterized protein n=1 Tax=Streptomyces virginiae TaxID=1961 RepID=A0ABQ3NXT5_STRVG|nr:hypothetical protein GCM10010215_27080 [Streptomyces virginiae]GHI17591.1 hypothetical protein Scinn_70540 [Streptomyces virginiae]